MRKILIASFAIISMMACTGKNTSNNQIDNQASNTPDSLLNAMSQISDATSMYLLIGTYTSRSSEGIYVHQFDTVSGYSKSISMTKIDNPSYLTLSDDQKFVYAVSENDDITAAASAYSFDKTRGELTLLNTQPTQGASPCYITVDNSGRHVVTANYSGSNITTFNTNADGSLSSTSDVISFTGKSTHPTRQTKPHLHCVRFTPDNKYLFATDLGTDRIYKFEVKDGNNGVYLKQGTPSSFSLKGGSGPRHIEFHPNGKYVYAITEISGDVVGYKYNNGNLEQMQTIKADTLNAQGSGDIHITPDGKYLYVSNRLKGDGIAIFSINQSSGQLTKIGYTETGVHPRNFTITPSGRFLLVACRDNNAIQVYEIDRATGLLINKNRDIIIDKPVCLQFASLH